MTIVEKLRFLADRAEDGKEFKIGVVDYCFVDGKLSCRTGNEHTISKISFVSLINYRDYFKLKPRWVFTEEEKTILKSMNPIWNYIARDQNNSLYVYDSKPIKVEGVFLAQDINHSLRAWKHLFQSVQWSDEEACPFREYL